MAITTHSVTVLDPEAGSDFLDRVVVAQKVGIAAAASVVVTFTEPLPTTYTVLVCFNATGATSYFVDTKTTFGFTVHMAGAPAGTFDVVVIAT